MVILQEALTRGPLGHCEPLVKLTVWGPASPVCILSSLRLPLPSKGRTHATEPSLDLQTKRSGPSKGKLYF